MKLLEFDNKMNPQILTSPRLVLLVCKFELFCCFVIIVAFQSVQKCLITCRDLRQFQTGVRSCFRNLGSGKVKVDYLKCLALETESIRFI